MPKARPNPQPARRDWLRWAGIAAVGLIVAGVLVLKTVDQPVTPVEAGEQVAVTAAQVTTVPRLPEEQLDQLLADGQPTLAFFHSDNCYQCVQMTGIVSQVYPEYAESVALVDVNVYDQRNYNLLRRAGIRVIPTLIFFDHQGRGQVAMGVMQPDQLRQQLQTISGGQ